MNGGVPNHPAGGGNPSPAAEDRRKYLELLQAVISRLAGNSFSIKGWAVGLMSILGGFAAKEADLRFATLLWFPALAFWGLDAFYLRQEKLFRALYNKVVVPDPAAPIPDFSMDTTPVAGNVPGWFAVAWTRTVWGLHLPIAIFVLVVMFWAGARH